MTRMGFARRLATTDRCLVGTWVKIPALEPVEILADAGFDYIVIDQEHAPLTLEFAYQATVVAQGAGMSVLVRVPDRSGSHLQRLLDSGVDGILVPRVTSVAEATASVRQMVFSPAGDRGLGTTSRAGRWGGTPRAEYLRFGDEEVMRAVQLEERAAIETVEDILDVPGLNGVFLGMGDLGLSSGLTQADPEFQKLVDRFLTAAHDRGVPAGTAVQTAAQAQEAADRGYRYVMVSNDTSLLRGAATSVVAGLGSRFTEGAPHGV
ncbi:HpcH/HpaI aldolase family protein [Actinoplanes friuliensis]|uniref:2-dehydro-3-deoxyglucarate aldolase n=1 Tax=Actinoplanes friuliensis DSM 7358 TaxID=1246995 RepID=U5W0G7_9ACTN|nr:aldolase/citrate lyase family protein [Actinoplanes friuliensis]AGZ41426.1 2-dehydro-3-deoxyglucarate aldolase [Actinoplanes friuliensis DSM 7358]